jgi:excisionase family DNA binding protein
MQPGDRTPLYVRLPHAQAASLDRLVAATGRRKQELVSELLSEGLVVGRAAVADEPAPAAEVLTLQEAAGLLRVSEGAVRSRAEAGDLPGRRLGQEWRFARSALLAWLLQGEPKPAPKLPDALGDEAPDAG